MGIRTIWPDRFGLPEPNERPRERFEEVDETSRPESLDEVVSGHDHAVPLEPAGDVQNTRDGFFDFEDVERLVAELAQPLRPLVRFAFLTGWRRGEILNLRWSAVDFTAGVVRLAPGTTKNKKGREFPFASVPPLRALLEGQRDRTRAFEREAGRIVTHVFHRKGRPIKTFQKAWNNACDRAGLAGMVFHDLRRSAVRDFERAGISRSTAMSFTGHKTTSVYERYAIVDTVAQQEGAAKLAALVDERAGEKTERTVVPIAEAGGR